ncbi:hypothetical protein TWF481_002667 [Arthrobotrys musiformis]|uniref:Uncharacterized protein n=1 Tax=Arthrobotrys musiformis TaxID=47236 RepID=A0AAV9VSW5_9PEZI
MEPNMEPESRLHKIIMISSNDKTKHASATRFNSRVNGLSYIIVQETGDISSSEILALLCLWKGKHLLDSEKGPKHLTPAIWEKRPKYQPSNGTCLWELRVEKKPDGLAIFEC